MDESMTAWCKARGCVRDSWDAMTVDAVARGYAALAELGRAPVPVARASDWARSSGAAAVAELAGVARRGSDPQRRKGHRVCCARPPEKREERRDLYEPLMPLIWFLESMERTPGDALRGHGDVMLDPYPDIRAQIARWYDGATVAS